MGGAAGMAPLARPGPRCSGFQSLESSTPIIPIKDHSPSTNSALAPNRAKPTERLDEQVIAGDDRQGDCDDFINHGWTSGIFLVLFAAGGTQMLVERLKPLPIAAAASCRSATASFPSPVLPQGYAAPGAASIAAALPAAGTCS
jgi:hypothetical protein